MTSSCVSVTRYSTLEVLCYVVQVLLMTTVLCSSASASKTTSITVRIEDPSQKISFLMSWEHSNVYKDGEFAIYASANVGSVSPSEVYIHKTNHATVNYTYDPCGAVKYQEVRIRIKTYFYTSPERVMCFEGVDYVTFSPHYKVTVTSTMGATEGSGEYPAGALLVPRANESEVRYDDVTYKLSKWLVKVAGEEPYYIEDGQEIEVEQVTDIEAVYSRYYLVRVLSQYGSVEGGGWYEEGGVATFGVEPKMLKVNGTSEVFFSHWEVNGVPVNQSYLIVDGPKIVTAVWSTRRTYPERSEDSAKSATSIQTNSKPKYNEDNVLGVPNNDGYREEGSSKEEKGSESQIRVMVVSPLGNTHGTGIYAKGTIVLVNVTPTSFIVDDSVRLSFYGWVDLISGELITKEPNLNFFAESDELLQAMWSLQYFVGGSWHNWDEVVELLPPEVEYISNETRKAFSGFWRKGSSVLIKSDRLAVQAWESILIEPVMETQHKLTICTEGLDGPLPVIIEAGNSSLTLSVAGKAQLWIREGDEVSLSSPEVVGNMTLRSISGENTSRVRFQMASPKNIKILYAPVTPELRSEASIYKGSEILTAMAILTLVAAISFPIAFRRRRELSLEELKGVLRGNKAPPDHAWIEDAALESLKQEDKELYIKALAMVYSGKLKIKARR